MTLTRSLSALRRACSTGRDAQTVTVRRGHLRELLAEYDRQNQERLAASLGKEQGNV